MLYFSCKDRIVGFHLLTDVPYVTENLAQEYEHAVGLHEIALLQHSLSTCITPSAFRLKGPKLVPCQEEQLWWRISGARG